MKKLLDSFVDWFNGLFGLDYAGYDWITALAFIFLAAVAFYFILKAAVRPLIPLFNAEHAKINAHLPDIEKGVREAHRRALAPAEDTSLATASSTSPRALETATPTSAKAPFIHILPMEDFNHASEDASKLAGLLADGLAETLTSIPQVDVTRTRVDDDLDEIFSRMGTRYSVSGKVDARDEDMSVSISVREADTGRCILKNTRVSSYDKMHTMEREFAAEIASAVLMHHRKQTTDGPRLVTPEMQAGQSGSKYPNGRRPSPALPRKTGRPAV